MSSKNLSVCSVPAARRARASVPVSVIGAILLATAAFAGCATSAASGEGDDAETGQIVLPLVQPGTHGETYFLANATFDITDVHGATTTVFGGGSETEVAVSLPPGIATVSLRPDWVLERSVDGGVTFQAVSALLGSPNPAAARVLANQPAFLQFEFLIRDVNGTLRIKLGVVPQPRELAGGLIVNTAVGDLAGYADPANRLMDFAIFFRLDTLQSVTLADGTKQHIYTAGPAGAVGPIPPQGSAVAAEFYNDNIGTLAGPIAAAFAAAFLQYTVAAKLDGSIELSGLLSGVGAEIDFAPSAIDGTLPTIGADGFPADEFFYHQTVPFTLTDAGGSISGILRMRHIVPTN